MQFAITPENMTILIADTVLCEYEDHLQYSNMMFVPMNMVPVNAEAIKKYIIIQGKNIGGNATFYDEDNPYAVKGVAIDLKNFLTPRQLTPKLATELGSGLLGGVEVREAGWRMLGVGGGDATEQELRIFEFVIGRGPGRIFPDFPNDFPAEIVDAYGGDWSKSH